MNDGLEVKSFKGAFLIHKEDGQKRRLGHDTFSAAEAEAGRLLRANPGATFIISREEARVRLRASASGVPITRRKS